MRTIQMSIEIDCPVEEVFAALGDARSQPRWDPGLVEARHYPDGPARLGTRVTEVREFLGRRMETEATLVEFEPNRRLVRQGGDPMLGRLRGVLTFDETATGTCVDWTWQLEMSGVKSVVEPLIAAILRRQGQGILGNLKDLLEGEGLHTEIESIKRREIT
jgi:uncharacterized protein YndB with AHSA1/START domain